MLHLQVSKKLYWLHSCKVVCSYILDSFKDGELRPPPVRQLPPASRVVTRSMRGETQLDGPGDVASPSSSGSSSHGAGSFERKQEYHIDSKLTG